MKTTFIVIAILFMFTISCTQLHNPPAILGTDKLITQLFKININKDTVLKTINGAYMDIPNGSVIAC